MDPDPDQDSPIARAGRTFLTLWVYITEAVSRFLRPEPPAPEMNDNNITHDVTDNNEHSEHGHTNNGTTQESEEEPQRVSSASSVSLSKHVVSWYAGSELEIEKDDDKTYKEGEGMIEEQAETGIDVASLPVTDYATENIKKECLKLYADAMVLKIFEDVNSRSHPGESLNIVAESSEENLSLTFPETRHHSESKMFDDNCEKEKPGNQMEPMEQNNSERYNNAKEESDSANTIEEDEEQDDTTFLFLGTMSENPDLDDADEGISDDVELSRLPSEQEESCIERHCLGTSATVKQEGSAQEEATAFKNTTPAKCEGQDFVELYSSCKESREGGPEHNNEPDRSATQRFLEVGNCKEVQTTLLQEEVESGEARRIQNSGSEAKGDSFEQTELMEKEEAMKDLFAVDIAGNWTNPILQDMKSGAEDKEFEVNFVSQDDAQEKEKTNNEILVDFEMDEGLYEAVAECDDGGHFTKCTGEADFLAFLDQRTDENDLLKTLPQTSIETESESLTVNSQYSGLDLKDMGEDLCVLETETVEEKTLSVSELQLGMTAEDVSCEDESLDVGNYETSASMEPNEKAKNNAFQDTYMLEQLSEPSCSEVIDDEILDLWIEQTSIDNTNLKGDGQDEMQPEMLDNEKIESILGQSIVCDANVSLTTTESGFFDQPLDLWGSHEFAKMEQMPNISSKVKSELEDISEFSIIKSGFEAPWKEDLLTKHLSQGLEAESAEAETLQSFDSEVRMSSPVMNRVGVDADKKPLTKTRTIFEVETMSNEIQNTVLMSDTLTEDLLTYGYQLPLQEEPKEDAIAEFKIKEYKDIYKVDDTDLDFTPQKSRIAVKNPRVRPPKDPRSLLHKISLEPSPSKPLNIPAGVPLGLKLPGLGAGFPVLKKTKKVVEHETETITQETKPEENDADGAKQMDSKHKPKWMPPGHPGFGNPLMSELKSKLKKTSKE